jgi:signal transduction histidine kinase
VAQRHARTRFEQGLQATNVATEFRLLRQEIGRALRHSVRGEVAATDVIAAELLIHDALDSAIGLALAALESELEELREDVLATTVHDIQQPISGLKGRLQLVLRSLSGPDPDHERVLRMIRQAVEETDRLSAMLSTLGSASRVALGRVELHVQPTDLREVVHTALERLGPETAVRCRIDIPPEAVTSGAWDRQLLERVVANLLSNAAKYSASSSPIELTVRNEDAAAKVAVRDQGIGLAPDELAELFQRYGRTRRARERGTEGAGLGLYVSRGIVEAHGGRIWAESPGPGRGTTVHLLLPLRSPVET